MKAKNLLKTKRYLSETVFIDLKVWQVHQNVPGSQQIFKYSLALVSNDVCVLRYDNEAGKGDHKHIGSTELPYVFEGLDALQADFWKDVETWLSENSTV
jgi:hypothetical protein